MMEKKNMESPRFITQDFWIVQVMALLETDKQLVYANINFLTSASKFKISFVANISLALLRRDLIIYDIRCYIQHGA